MLACSPETRHDPLKLGLGIFLTLGMMISYIPQHVKLIKLKTSEGISPWWLLFSGTASTCTVLNLWILQSNTMKCCASWSAGFCVENLLGVIQVTVQWFALYFIILLFIYYYPAQEKHVRPIASINDETRRIIMGTDSATVSEFFSGSISQTARVAVAAVDGEVVPLIPKTDKSISKPYRNALLIILFLIIFFLVTSSLALVFVLRNGSESKVARNYAGTLGLISMVLATIQFIPQIWETYSIKHVGALSIPMMLIQCPGSFLFAYSLWLQPGTNITSYLSYLCSGTLQFILLCLALYYSRKPVAIQSLPQHTSTDEVEPLTPSTPTRPKKVKRRLPSALDWSNSYQPSSLVDEHGIVQE